MATKQPLISSREAAQRLGIKVETLYAYVSRGLIQTHRVDHLRGSRFDPADVDSLAQRGRGATRRNPLTITSAVTRIDGTHYWYRGIDPITLVGNRSFEQVSELLWGVESWTDAGPWTPRARAVSTAQQALDLLASDTPPFDRLRVVSSVISALDDLRADLAAPSVVSTARTMIATLVASLIPSRGTDPGGRWRDGSSVAGGLAAALKGSAVSNQTPSNNTASNPAADELSTTHLSTAEVAAVETALILLADHELAASTMAARTAAAFRADPHAVTAAGMGTLAGAWHGGASAAAEELLRDIVELESAERAVARHLRDGSPLPGLGQPLYPEGDPRASALFAAARRAAPNSAVHAALDEFLIICADRGYPEPNCDLGLAALSVGLDLVAGAGETIFAVARTAGWIAHALEEYESPSDLRPRAVYTGRR